jgi:hypothetical protein
MKDERVFTTRDEMVLTIFSDICRSLSYIGSKPLCPTDLVIDPEGRWNPQSGYSDEHQVFVKQKCVGFCDLV